jgi:hypothetical protein
MPPCRCASLGHQRHDVSSSEPAKFGHAERGGIGPGRIGLFQTKASHRINVGDFRCQPMHGFIPASVADFVSLTRSELDEMLYCPGFVILSRGFRSASVFARRLVIAQVFPQWSQDIESIGFRGALRQAHFSQRSGGG